MALFQPPPLTRYDLTFSVAGIPVRVHPAFWLVAALLGGSGNTFLGLLIWVFVVFVSILVHELGHSLAMGSFGQPSYIVLYFGGGLAVRERSLWGDSVLGRRQNILVSLAGPFAGFLFAGLITAAVAAAGGVTHISLLFGIIPIPQAFFPSGAKALNLLVFYSLSVNVFWGLFNLLPVFPLDGGQVARHVMTGIDPWDGYRNSLWISVVTGALIAFVSLFLLKSVYIAFLFGFLAIQSYQSLQGQYGRGF